MKQTRYTYILMRRSTGLPFYVGETGDLNQRFSSHIKGNGNVKKWEQISEEAEAGGSIVMAPILMTDTKEEAQATETIIRFLLCEAGYELTNPVYNEQTASKWIDKMNKLRMSKQGVILLEVLQDKIAHPFINNLFDCTVGSFTESNLCRCAE